MALNLAVKPQKSVSTIMLLMPVAYFVVLLVVSYFVVKAGYAKIKSLRASIASAKKVESVLAEKESILKTVSANISYYVLPVSIALPEKNPALYLISQIRSLSEQNATDLQEFKLGSAGQGQDSQLNLSLSLRGDYPNVISLLNGLETLAPILSLNKVEMSLSGSVVNADMVVGSYWSAYPDKLPSVTDPIQELTKTNNETLKKVVQLTPPFFTTLTPTEPYGRQNPFF
jgi:hypothetical protein